MPNPAAAEFGKWIVVIAICLIIGYLLGRRDGRTLERLDRERDDTIDVARSLLVPPSALVVDAPPKPASWPPAGEVLGSYCDSHDLWSIFANGDGGTYERIVIENSLAECSNPGRYPVRYPLYHPV